MASFPHLKITSVSSILTKWLVAELARVDMAAPVTLLLVRDPAALRREALWALMEILPSLPLRTAKMELRRRSMSVELLH